MSEGKTENRGLKSKGLLQLKAREKVDPCLFKQEFAGWVRNVQQDEAQRGMAKKDIPVGEWLKGPMAAAVSRLSWLFTRIRTLATAPEPITFIALVSHSLTQMVNVHWLLWSDFIHRVPDFPSLKINLRIAGQAPDWQMGKVKRCFGES